MGEVYDCVLIVKDGPFKQQYRKMCCYDNWVFLTRSECPSQSQSIPVKISRSECPGQCQSLPVKNTTRSKMSRSKIVPVKKCPGQKMSRSKNVSVKKCPGQNITFKISRSECLFFLWSFQIRLNLLTNQLSSQVQLYWCQRGAAVLVLLDSW